MAAYLRIEGLNPEDLDQMDGNLFGDLANDVFNQIRTTHPGLYSELDGVIPVRQPEHDPRLLEATPVYAHRDASVDDGVSDFVFCTFGDGEVEHLDAPGYASPAEFVEVKFVQAFDAAVDGGHERLDDVLPTEAEREQAGDDPLQVGTLYYDSERVVRVDFDRDVLDGESENRHAAACGTGGP